MNAWVVTSFEEWRRQREEQNRRRLEHEGSPPEPPAWFYEGVGRVVVACADLDLRLAVLVDILTGSSGKTFQVATQPGRPLRELRRIASQLPSGPFSAEMLGLVRDAKSVFEERNRVTHSVVGTDGEPQTDGENTFSALQPRAIGSGVGATPLPSADDLGALAERVQDLLSRSESAFWAAWNHMGQWSVGPTRFD